MEDFRRQFLVETVEKLESLRQNLRGGEFFSAEHKRETLRLLHTIKGTAQTFGYISANRLAHDLETLVSGNGNEYNILAEGIELLQKSLSEENFQLSGQFREKIQAGVSQKPAANNLQDMSAEIPAEFYSRLSVYEKEKIGSAARGGKNLTILEIGFETADFAARLIDFRKILDSSGEIIATFPSGKIAAEGKIGFQFLTAGLENPQSVAAENGADVLWENSTRVSVNDLDAILRQIIRHGREIAEQLDKKIEIEVENDELNLPAAELKIVFETLLHLVRNAVDHAIERAGKIKISLKKEAGGLRLSVKDDGRGIDLERIKARAVEKKIVSGDEDLDENESLELIFEPELSTKTETTEISGRGIGLDTVKNSIEKSGGKINVETGKGKGTTFEIFLPHKKS